MESKKNPNELLQSEQQDKGGELGKLVDALRPRYASLDALAQTMKTSRRTIFRCRQGRGEEKTTGVLIEQARALIASQAVNDASPAAEQVPHPQPPSAPASAETARAVPTELLERFGGKTSPLGVKFVLSPEVFKDIEGEPGDDGIELTRRSIEFVRGLLNLFAQLKNPEIRRRVRERLNREVEELEVAIQVFTVQHPNRLTPLYEAQRLTWAAEERSKKKR